MKARVAIYYHNHLRNDGPPLFYFYNLQKKFGKANVMHLVPEGDTSRYGKFDYHFWIDYGEDSFIPNAGEWKIPDDGGKKIYVVSDAHLDNGYRYNFAKNFDYVFFNQKHYLHEYKPVGEQKVFYLPHAAEPKAYPHFKMIPKYDIAFIGHMQEYHKGNGINMTRVDFLDAMFKEFPNFYFGTRNPAWPEKNMFEDAAKHFCEAKIVLNISVGNDLNMRFWETLSTGSFLLTNKIPELKNAEDYGFVDGVHYVSYTTLEDAKQKTKYYLEHDNQREKIASAGLKQSRLTGAYMHRINEIISKVSPSL